MVQDQLILDRYRPIAEAGSGGFATVQLAWDTRIQRQVAIKCIELNENDQFRVVQDEIRQRYGEDALTTRSFSVDTFDSIPGLDEARTAAMLQDPHIVGVFDFEVQGSMAYLIMEYIDGVTLSELLAEYELDLNEVAAIFTSIAAALETAHAHQVLHLDIKPDNILINRQGQVKVTDFGLATLSDAMGFATAAGGTIGYMPLEQMRQENLDVRCDEWALASVAYEMLMDENPFRAPDLRRAEIAIEDAELVLPSVTREDLDAGVDDVLFYALDPNKEERYETVTDFAEEMTSFLGNAARGHKQLATLVGQAVEDDLDSSEDQGRSRKRQKEGPGFFARLTDWLSAEEKLGSRGRAILVRIWAALGAGLLAAASLNAIPAIGGLTSPLFWAFFALCLVGAAIKPWLGTLFAIASLCAALITNGAIVLGILVAIATIPWWFFTGRHGDAAANIALMPVLFGSFGFALITPLASGFALKVRHALTNTLFAAVIALVLASLGSSSLLGWSALEALGIGATAIDPVIAAANASLGKGGFAGAEAGVIKLLTTPMIWCTLISWLATSAVLSALCSRENRLLAALGVLIGVAILTAGQILGTGIESGFSNLVPATSTIITLAVALITMLAASAIQVPERPYEEPKRVYSTK